MFKVNRLKTTLLLTLLAISVSICAQGNGDGIISGRIISGDKDAARYATVKLKGTGYGSATNAEGLYHVKAPAGEYTLVVTAVGYETVEKKVAFRAGERIKMNIRIHEEAIQLGEVSVVSAGVSRVKNSAYNAVAVDTRGMLNTTKSLSEALAKAPGLKLRESGGVGSDMNLMLDGFSGKHVKVFIDGVPQEGVGSSFGLNNIPVNFADRIEVYKGVVPVGFGTDAIGGVINIVTNKKRRRWFVDAAYSYGSFNTHKSHVNFGQTFSSGFTYEINAFQNYSDNDYYVDAPVFDFATNMFFSQFYDNPGSEYFQVGAGMMWYDEDYFTIGVYLDRLLYTQDGEVRFTPSTLCDSLSFGFSLYMPRFTQEGELRLIRPTLMVQAGNITSSSDSYLMGGVGICFQLLPDTNLSFEVVFRSYRNARENYMRTIRNDQLMSLGIEFGRWFIGFEFNLPMEYYGGDDSRPCSFTVSMRFNT